MADDHGGDREESASSDAADPGPDDRDEATDPERPDDRDDGDTADDGDGDEHDVMTPADVDTPSVGRPSDEEEKAGADDSTDADADGPATDDGEDAADGEGDDDAANDADDSTDDDADGGSDAADERELDDSVERDATTLSDAEATSIGSFPDDVGANDDEPEASDGDDSGPPTGDESRHGQPTAADRRHEGATGDEAAGRPARADRQRPADPAGEAGGRADGGMDTVNDVPGYEPQEVPTGGGVSAPDDEEMPLAEHIEEMVMRLAWVVGALIVVAAVSFPVADRLINFLWYSFLPGSVSACPPPPEAKLSSVSAACPFVYHPLALMFARIKMAGLVGFVAALPVLVYQSYLFMRPGLYPRERRYYLASVPTSLVLAGIGMSFAYFLVLPTLFAYFTEYSEAAADIAFGLTETFNLIVMMLGFFALIFQIPLFIMLAVMMGVASRRWLARRRIYFWGGFATIAFVFSPDPTGMAPILVAVTMIILFEGTLLLLYWTGEASAFASPEALAARRPFAWLVAALAGYLASTAPLPDTYYDHLPSVFTSTLADLASTRLTPLVIGGALILVYEVLLYAHRRVRGRDRLARMLARARVFVWPVSLLVGYFGSPDPVLLRRVDAVDLATPEAAGLAVGLIVAYELLIVARRWLANRRLW